MFDKKLLESAELYQKRYKNFATLIILPVFIFALFLVGFTIFAKKELTVTGIGQVAPVKIIAQIQSTSSSKIVSNELVEGKNVKDNETLVKYESNSDVTQLSALNTQLSQAKNQKAAIISLQNSLTSGTDKFKNAGSYGYEQQFQDYLSQAQTLKDNVAKANQSVSDQNNTTNTERAAINSQIDTLNTQISQYTAIENAISNGTTPDSSNPYIAQYNSYNAQIKASPTQKATIQSQAIASIEASIAQLQSAGQSLNVQGNGLASSNAYDESLDSQLDSLKAEELSKANQTMTSLDSNIADLNAKIALQNQSNQNSILTSPSTGVLHILPNVLGLKQISIGTPIAEIYPALTDKSTVDLLVYVSSSDISAVKIGQIMRLSVKQNLPQPLILDGQIKSIDSAPTTENNLNVYAVKAEVQLTKDELVKVRYGLQGNIVIVTGKKTYFDYYKDKVMGEN